MRAIALSLLFLFSGIGASVLLSPASASPNTSAPLAPAPAAAALTQAQANWAFPNGNAFGQDYNPQNQINSSSAQYLGLSWLFPLPSHPTALVDVSGGYGVDTAPLVVNGTIYAVTQFDQVFALNAATGDVLWTDILPVNANSTAALKGVGGVSLHIHDGVEQFTTSLFNHTPTYWISAANYYVYAINALNGNYELNFSDFGGTNTIPGNNPVAVDPGFSITNILVDQNRGIVISSVESGSSAETGRCFYHAFNVLVNPVQLLWTTYCTPPQPGSNIPVDPNWDISQVNNMTGAEIFYPGPTYNGGGTIPGTAVVNLKTLSPSVLNSTLYNDWGYADQSAACLAYDGGSSPGSTAAEWGGQFLLGTGPTAGLAYLGTNNRDPYTDPCTNGPNLWSAAIMAVNETNGNWVWGFQTAAHEVWDYDCSWWQGMGNETINGATTQVIWKTCKNGYLYELNALTGNMIWAWTGPSSIMPRCPYCYMLNPLNQTQMTEDWMAPNHATTLQYPSDFAGIEAENAYSPTLNYLFIATQNVPALAEYVPWNTTTFTDASSGINYYQPNGSPGQQEPSLDNNTLFAVNAVTGATVWHYSNSLQGYRGGVATTGNMVLMTLSSGDMLMVNAQTGALVRDYYIGGPLNVLPTVGATATGQEEIIVPITAGAVSWATAVPGDLVALKLENVPTTTTTLTTTTTSTTTSTTTAPGSVITTTVTGPGGQIITTTTTILSTITGPGGSVITTTSTLTSVSTSSSGVSSTALYGVAVVAVIFIIATGYLAMRGRKPAS